MRSIDASKKHAVALTFLLDAKISPHDLAQQLATACGGSVLKPGEGILVEHAKIACVVTDETLSLPSFGYLWRPSLKKPKKLKLTRNRCR
jgi:hypothetical protein